MPLNKHLTYLPLSLCCFYIHFEIKDKITLYKSTSISGVINCS